MNEKEEQAGAGKAQQAAAEEPQTDYDKEPQAGADKEPQGGGAQAGKAGKKAGRPVRPFSVSDMERTTFTLSIAMVTIGLFCLPHVEKNGSSWYVLMLVFGINAVLLIWILCRIIRRRKKG